MSTKALATLLFLLVAVLAGMLLVLVVLGALRRAAQRRQQQQSLRSEAKPSPDLDEDLPTRQGRPDDEDNDEVAR